MVSGLARRPCPSCLGVACICLTMQRYGLLPNLPNRHAIPHTIPHAIPFPHPMGQQSSRQPKSAPSARETNHRACLTRPHREGRGGAPIFLTRKTRSSQKTIRHILMERMPRRGNRFHGTCTPSSLISKLCDSACPIAPASPAPWGGLGRGLFPWGGPGRGLLSFFLNTENT